MILEPGSRGHLEAGKYGRARFSSAEAGQPPHLVRLSLPVDQGGRAFGTPFGTFIMQPNRRFQGAAVSWAQIELALAVLPPAEVTSVLIAPKKAEAASVRQHRRQHGRRARRRRSWKRLERR